MHAQYRASRKKVLGVLESPGTFYKQENGNPGYDTAGRMMFFRLSFCPLVRLSLLAQYIINHWGKFHQIYSFGAVGNKDELT